MAITNTFDALDGLDTSEQDAAAQRALAEGSRIVEEQEAARQQRFDDALKQDQEQSRYAGKYKSAEELEKAYLELQKKLGEKSAEKDTDETPPEASDEADEAQEDASDDEEESDDSEALQETLQVLAEASSEFNDNEFSLKPETIEKLSQLDSRSLIEAWVKYTQTQREQTIPANALSQDEANRIKESVGGEKAYSEILSWASENLNPTDIAAYDSVINSGSAEAIYWAAQGLKARYAESVGFEGNTYSGARAPAPEPGFRSQAELARAISDPRYKNDPAYRLDVQDKLARSGNLL
jgi:hypothetical protein